MNRCEVQFDTSETLNTLSLPVGNTKLIFNLQTLRERSPQTRARTLLAFGVAAKCHGTKEIAVMRILILITNSAKHRQLPTRTYLQQGVRQQISVIRACAPLYLCVCVLVAITNQLIVVYEMTFSCRRGSEFLITRTRFSRHERARAPDAEDEKPYQPFPSASKQVIVNFKLLSCTISQTILPGDISIEPRRKKAYLVSIKYEWSLF